MGFRQYLVEVASLILYVMAFVVASITLVGLDQLLSLAAPLYVAGLSVLGLIGLYIWDVLFTPIFVKFLG